ncbi:response regulator [bacterium]|nr:response regulator [candidate division CSSED10-310 bacterium]
MSGEGDWTTILVVDDDAADELIIRRFLEPQGYRVLCVHSGLHALDLVDRDPPDLVLLDVNLPDMNGFEVCRNLKQDERTRLIPVVMLTSMVDLETRLLGFDAGADDFLTKDFNEMILVVRMRALIRMKRMNDSLLRAEQVILTLVKALEVKDPYTQGHSSRVKLLSEAVAREMGFDEEDVALVGTGAMLHDIGKIGLSDVLLNKPGPLSNEEYDSQVLRHVEIGARILEPLNYPDTVIHIVRHHHEKMDGSGYPDGLTGAGIPMTTRIVSVVDMYDAMRFDRAYRKGESRERVMAYLERMGEQGKLDDTVITALARINGPVLMRLQEMAAAVLR